MAESSAAEVTVVPLSRALLQGVEDPAGHPRRGVDLWVLPCFEDERPLQGLAGLADWRLGGTLSALLRSGFFSGARGEALLLPARRTLPAQRLVLLGLGPSGSFDRARAEATGERLVEVVDGLCPRDVLVAMPGRVPDRAVVESVFDGLARALQRSMLRRSDASRPAVRAVRDDAAPHVVEPANGSAADDEEDGVVALPAMAEERAAGIASGPAHDGGSAPTMGLDGPRWWVVADPRHEARLRRLQEGPPRAAEQGA